MFISDSDHLVSKTYMTRVEGLQKSSKIAATDNNTKCATLSTAMQIFLGAIKFDTNKAAPFLKVAACCCPDVPAGLVPPTPSAPDFTRFTATGGEHSVAALSGEITPQNVVLLQVR